MLDLTRSGLAPEIRFRPWRREEYDRLIDLGMFADENIELLDGMLVRMSPIGSQHFEATHRVHERLLLALRGRAVVARQGPLAASDWSEPQPDVIVVPKRDYSQAIPSKALLVVEVSDSTLQKARDVKLPIYAKARVPEVWIVNLRERCLEVYRRPRGSAYSSRSVRHEGSSIRPLKFRDVVVDVTSILPTPRRRKRQGKTGTRTTNGSS